MPKTLTIRIDDKTYRAFKNAAIIERRSVSNFIENAVLSYLENEEYVSDEEMNEISENKELLEGLRNGLLDIKKGRYKLVR